MQNSEQNKRDMPVFSQRELSMQKLIDMQADEIRKLKQEVQDMKELLESL